jgi:hypothetical protein
LLTPKAVNCGTWFGELGIWNFWIAAPVIKLNRMSFGRIVET